MTITLTTWPASPGELNDGLRPLIPALVAIDNARDAVERGHSDFLTSVQGRESSLTSNAFADIDVVTADRDGTIVGYGVVAPFRNELTGRGATDVTVHPDARRRGIGNLLYDEAITIARAGGCRVLTTAFAAPLADPTDARALRSSTDPIAAEPCAASDFLLGRGWSIGQIERASTLEVPDAVPEPRIADGYRIETWEGPSNHDRAGALAAIFSAFTRDVPEGDMDAAPQDWDADRMIEMEASELRTRTVCSALARTVDGRPVGYTQLWRSLTRETYATQGVTEVLATDRGNGLGRALKLACLRQAHASWPRLERVHTWNAGENDHMWAINEALGFVPHGADVDVQLRLD